MQRIVFEVRGKRYSAVNTLAATKATEDRMGMSFARLSDMEKLVSERGVGFLYEAIATFLYECHRSHCKLEGISVMSSEQDFTEDFMLQEPAAFSDIMKAFSGLLGRKKEQ